MSINSVTNIQNEMIQEERAKTVVLNMLNQIDPQTRNTVRKIASVETITFDQIFRNRTRSDSSTTNSLLDSLVVTRQPALYVVNLENNEGTAVVEAPIFIGGDQAVIDTTSTNDGKLLFITDSTLNNTDKITSDGTDTNIDTTTGSTTLGPDINEQEQFLSSMVADYLEGKFTVDGGYTENTGSNSLDELCAATIGPLLATQWHQFMPFNGDMPEGFDEEKQQWSRCPAGCPTIAVAQFLVYMKNVSLVDVFGIENVSWEDMATVERVYYKTELESGSIADTVANLVRQIGDGIGVSYSITGSSASIGEVCGYLKSLGYNAKVYSYNDENLMKIITCLLHRQSPVIIRGRNSGKGHQWVIDGYYLQESCSYDYYLHCNYGWESTRSNGWYHVDMFESKDGDDIYYDKRMKFIVLE